MQHGPSHIVDDEDAKYCANGINVRAANLYSLTRLSIQAFDENGNATKNNWGLPKIFFLMYKWFTTTEDLIDIFENLFEEKFEIIICDVSQCNHTSKDSLCDITKFVHQICNSIKYWIQLCPQDFDLNQKVKEKIAQFKNLISDEGYQGFSQLMTVSQLPSYDWMRNVSMRPSPHPNYKARKVSLVFNHIEPHELADHFTYLDYKECRRITFNDFKNYAISGDVKLIPRLEKSIILFNAFSRWIQCMILNKTTPQHRAKVMAKFVDVTKRLLEINNFNTLMAVVGGLLHSSLARLYKTISFLPLETINILIDLSDLLSSALNYQNYRRALQKLTANSCNHIKSGPDKQKFEDFNEKITMIKSLQSLKNSQDTLKAFSSPAYNLGRAKHRAVISKSFEYTSPSKKFLYSPKLDDNLEIHEKGRFRQVVNDVAIKQTATKSISFLKSSSAKIFSSFPEIINGSKSCQIDHKNTFPGKSLDFSNGSYGIEINGGNALANIEDKPVINTMTFKESFRMPILGVHLKDLISLNAACPDYLNAEALLINVRKMALLMPIMEELTRLQNVHLPFEPDMDLVNTLRLSLDMPYTEEEIYELSLAREPRTIYTSEYSPFTGQSSTNCQQFKSLNSESSSSGVLKRNYLSKHQVFAEWAAGAKPAPDPETLNRHIDAMVDAVFKNYDTDRDGYISGTEFDSITGNFPFIDSFVVLDADRDGVISKEELKNYFYRANCHALRSGFKHAFQETTYFKLTFCIHCTGLLWGLIKQGYRCKDCGINAHKHCKDVVVLECRTKQRSLLNPGRSLSFAGADVKTVSKRKLLDQDSEANALFKNPENYSEPNHENVEVKISEMTKKSYLNGSKSDSAYDNPNYNVSKNRYFTKDHLRNIKSKEEKYELSNPSSMKPRKLSELELLNKIGDRPTLTSTKPLLRKQSAIRPLYTINDLNMRIKGRNMVRKSKNDKMTQTDIEIISSPQFIDQFPTIRNGIPSENFLDDKCPNPNQNLLAQGNIFFPSNFDLKNKIKPTFHSTSETPSSYSNGIKILVNSAPNEELTKQLTFSFSNNSVPLKMSQNHTLLEENESYYNNASTHSTLFPIAHSNNSYHNGSSSSLSFSSPKTSPNNFPFGLATATESGPSSFSSDEIFLFTEDHINSLENDNLQNEKIAKVKRVNTPNRNVSTQSELYIGINNIKTILFPRHSNAINQNSIMSFHSKCDSPSTLVNNFDPNLEINATDNNKSKDLENSFRNCKLNEPALSLTSSENYVHAVLTSSNVDKADSNIHLSKKATFSTLINSFSSKDKLAEKNVLPYTKSPNPLKYTGLFLSRSFSKTNLFKGKNNGNKYQDQLCKNEDHEMNSSACIEEKVSSVLGSYSNDARKEVKNEELHPLRINVPRVNSVHFIHTDERYLKKRTFPLFGSYDKIGASTSEIKNQELVPTIINSEGEDNHQTLQFRHKYSHSKFGMIPRTAYSDF